MKLAIYDVAFFSIHECKVVELYHSDYVQIDTHADLLPLIQMHTKYDITRDKGRHHHISYNISALEKQVGQRWISINARPEKSRHSFISYSN